jgi:hypothetical protein
MLTLARDLSIGTKPSIAESAVSTGKLSEILVYLRQYGPGTMTLSPSSHTACITFSIASVAPAVRTTCSGFTG